MDLVSGIQIQLRISGIMEVIEIIKFFPNLAKLQRE